MKLVAVVNEGGDLKLQEFTVLGDVLWHGLVEDNALTVGAPEDIENLSTGGHWFTKRVAVDAPAPVPEPEVNQVSAGYNNYDQIRMDIRARLIEAKKDGIEILSFTFGYQEPDVEIAPTGEIFLFCTAQYRDSIFKVTAKSHLGRDFVVNYLEKLVWERLRSKAIKADAAHN